MEIQVASCQGRIHSTINIMRHIQEIPESFQLDTIESWMFSSDDVHFDPHNSCTILGQGGFGTVMKGKYHGLDVAVKRYDQILFTDSVDLEKQSPEKSKRGKISHTSHTF